MIEIVLNNGMVAIVDDDMAHLATHCWFADVRKTGVVYARRNKRIAPASWLLVRLHREVLGYGPGDPLVDHIDGDGLNCRRMNLRDSRNGPNQRNRSGAQVNGSSGVLGVSWDRSRRLYRAHISFDGREKFLGRFATLEEASEARAKAEVSLWGVEPRREAVVGHVADER